MILNSLDKQLKLAEDGQISWQKDLTDPRPGEVIATIVKGDTLLAPRVKLIDAPALAEQDQEAVLAFTQEWLERHIKTALEPLFKLQDDDIAEGAPREIATKLQDALGILPREELESLISKMEEEGRATLRSKKIRFGPLLVYLPELNKPASVRLRALLLSLWNDKDLPAEVPADGIVSFSVADNEIDKAYYQAIGYPVYGPRSIRVDMLDRVVCAVYDTAKDGKFMAQHQMAEWLGSNIADLYAVLEAMGHTKDYDPADEVKEEEPKEAEPKAETSEAEDKNEENKTDGPVVISTEKKEQVKPDLATFRLKKGKAINAGAPKVKSNKKFGDGKNFSSDKKKFKSKGKKPQKKNQGQRVYTAEAEAKPEDNPFAILEQLKSGSKD
jgi:ATP-dependent RNA helicase SUPV3L1/SUV3